MTIESVNLSLRVTHYLLRFIAYVQKKTYARQRKEKEISLREMQRNIDTIARRTLSSESKLAAVLFCLSVLLMLRTVST